MDFFRIITATLAALTCFSLSYLAYVKTKRIQASRYFALMNLTLGLWNLGDLAMYYAPTHQLKLFFDRYSYVWAILLVPCIVLLVVSMTKISMRSWIIRMYYGITIALLAIVFTPLIIKNIKTEPHLIEEPGPLYPLFALALLSGIGYAVYRFYLAYRSTSGYKRNQLKFMYLGLFFALLAAINYFICMSYPTLPPLYYILEIIYTGAMGYAIIRYRLLDFGLLIRRSLTYGTMVVILSLIAGLAIGLTEKLIRVLFGGIPGIPTLVGVGIMMAVYEPLRKRINVFVDKFVLHSPDMENILNQFREVVIGNHTIQDMSANLSAKLKEAWGVGHAGLVLWESGTGKYLPMPKAAFKNKMIAQIKRYRIDNGDFLVKNLKYEKRLFFDGIVISDEAKALANRSYPGERVTFLKVRRTMRLLGAELCAPVMAGETLAGFLVLGPKKNKTIFSLEERKLISEIARMVSDAVKSLVQIPEKKSEKKVHPAAFSPATI